MPAHRSRWDPTGLGYFRTAIGTIITMAHRLLPVRHRLQAHRLHIHTSMVRPDLHPPRAKVSLDHRTNQKDLIVATVVAVTATATVTALVSEAVRVEVATVNSDAAAAAAAVARVVLGVSRPR